MSSSVNWFNALRTQEVYKNLPEKLLQRQVDLECLMKAEGLLRHDREVEQAKGNALESMTSHGRALLRDNIKPVADEIAKEFAEINSGKPGLGNSAMKQLLDLAPETISFIALRSMLNTISYDQTLQFVAINIGGEIEDELRYTKFEKEASERFQFAARRAERSTTYHRKRKAMNTMMQHTAQGIFDGMPHPELNWEPWSLEKKLGIGTRLINLVLSKLPIAEVTLAKYKPTDKQPQLLVVPTDDFKQWVKDYNLATALLAPVNLPCVIPPKDFANPTDGGYHTHLVPLTRLIKTHDRAYLDDLHSRTGQMKDIYDAVNIAQRTPWRINRRVYDVLHRVWRTGLTHGGLPMQEDASLPRCPKCGRVVKEQMTKGKPHACFSDETIVKAWKQSAAVVHGQNARAFSKRLLVHRVLWAAEEMLGDERIYFPYQLDFRGRLYAVPQFLNPQGHDIAKGLLEFAEAKPIMDEAAANWLAIHVANTWGEDKASFDDRVKWVRDNEQMILAIADDPLGNTEWSDADSPYCFLAACFEWADFVREGYGYLSRIPVAQDGTCSGLQHYSALLRDETGGRAVNLIPSDRPQDIYAVVAARTIEALESFIPGEDDYDLAQQWLCSGLINRKITKRSVMTLPYGSTLYSAKKYIREYVEEVREKSAASVPWSMDETGKACNFLGNVVWFAIRRTVVAAANAMDWLKQVAHIMTDAGLPLTWTSPTGLPVLQAYTKAEHRRVNTYIAGSVVFKTTKERRKIKAGKPDAQTRIIMTLKEPGDELDGAKQATGLAPNFIHSMDAAAMVLAVKQARAEGVESFSLIHDSFGTHAADSARLAAALRDAFVQMYEEHDVLAEFKEGIESLIDAERAAGIPPLPKRGSLNLQEVNRSKYFFA